MDAIGIAARVAVGVVLVVAGFTKLRTRSWGMLALEAGTPRIVVITLPAFEVLLGAALIMQLFSGFLSWVAVALFAAFTVVVLQRYLAGSRAPCNCFGSKNSQEPVTLLTVLRNLALFAVALVGALL